MNARNAIHEIDVNDFQATSTRVELVRMRAISDEWHTLHESTKTVENLICQLASQLSDHLEEIDLPQLSVPASREECIAAAEVVRNRSNGKIADLSSHETELRELLEQSVEQMRMVLSYLRPLVEERLGDPRDNDETLEWWSHRRTCRQADFDLAIFENLLLFVDEEIAIGYSCQLQRHLLRMMKGQPDELKEWFVKDQCGGAHVAFFEDVKRGVVLEEKGDRSKKTDDGIFPPEIKSFIYAQLDLETCLNLRQVNHSWYTAFQNNESLWERKLGQRNPRMKPDGSQLCSWAECVLVFVARTKSWPTVDKIDKIERENCNQPAQCESVVAVELEREEKLTDNFKGMVEHDEPHCNVIVCEQYHCATFDRHFFHAMNPQTQEISSIHFPTPELVHSDETHNIIRYKDTGMVLPTNFTPRRITSIKERPGYILVILGLREAALLPREDPHIDSGLHFMDGETAPDRDTYFFEDVYMTRGELPAANPHETECLYSIADFNTKEMKSYALASTRNQPVAIYNGLIWWSINNTQLVPTFIDYERPGQVFYCSTKAITVPIHDPQWITQGSKSRNCSQFVFGVRHKDYVAAMVNLATGVVTSVDKPRDEEEGKVIPGFQNGNFYPRYLSESAARTWDMFTEEITENDALW